ncbi:diguanylate cyclase (GGDEF)-like protein [Halospina denitrificans]|uniref:diguanylate cyclase n=1 Tax=Halospina denitrificans TaxID=332522 RepID=A0A4R7K254_9GAMM|nr:diguanylate cyclase [Halospina denitrificans]TDT44464.1 diguanylate cyclase (GGDEF)-like protein [Halospina denitrificans]
MFCITRVMINRALPVLALLLAVCWASAVNADASPSDPIVLEADSLPYSIGGDFQYLVDPGSELDIDSVRATRNEDWRPLSDGAANFGFARETYWFRADLRGGSEARESWLLELGYPLLDYVDLFVVRQGEVTTHYATGDQLPFDQRPFPHRNFLFPLSLADNESARVYVRVESSSAVQMPLSVTSHEALVQSEQTRLTAHAMYFGIVAVMVLYNLFIMMSIRDRAYLAYVVFVLSIGGFQLSLHGFGYQFVWPQSPWLQDTLTGTLIATASLSAAWFALVFLGVEQYSRNLSRILRAIVVLGAALTLLSFFIPYGQIIRMAAGLAFVCALLAQVTGLYIWYHGYKPAAHYSIAFAAVLLGTALMVLNKFGMIPRNAVTENGQQIGSLLQLVLLSLALAYRIKVLRDENEQAQLEATTRLEQRVQERTIELEEANSQLQQLSSLDPLTGTYNRRYLDDYLRAEWNRALRGRYSISVIMLDIDHFKLFNDNYGHAVGDEALRFLARHLLGCIYRTPDVVVRYGGEEFVVVLPSTNARGAETIARRIRKTLSRHPFPVGRSTEQLRVSQGIAAMVPSPDEAPDNLLLRADEALYEAKDAGRDCFRHYRVPQ